MKTKESKTIAVKISADLYDKIRKISVERSIESKKKYGLKTTISKVVREILMKNVK